MEARDPFSFQSDTVCENEVESVFHVKERGSGIRSEQGLAVILHFCPTIQPLSA